MINERIFEMQEKVVRKVGLSGNGAHTFVPKEWAGEEVLIVRISKLDIRKEVLKILEPFLENIIAAFIFGSYARGEQNERSDVDVLVITDKPIKIKKKGFDMVVISEDNLEKAKKINPILYYSAINEGKSIVNTSYLERLKEEKIKTELFKEYYISTKLNLDSNKEILKLDRVQNLEYASDSAIYSLFLRLRGIFIINCILKKENYSNSKFRKWLVDNIPGLDYNAFYYVYASIRDNKKTTNKINIKVGESLIDLLCKEIK